MNHSTTKNVFKQYFKFAFIRNPFDRIISEYFYSEEAKKIKWKEYLQEIFHPDESRAIILYKARFEKHKFMGHRKRLSFREFLLEVAIPNKLKSCDQDLDRHFKSQRTFLTDQNGQLLVDFVGRFETLEEDFGKIRDRLGLTENLSHIDRTSHCRYPRYYDDETRRLVYELYEEDFEMFDYRF